MSLLGNSAQEEASTPVEIPVPGVQQRIAGAACAYRPEDSPDSIQGPPPALAAPRGLRGIFSRGENGAYEPMDVDSLPENTVLINIYDVGEEELIQKVNRYATLNDRVLLGGVYHAGVELYGHEWGYGGTEEDITGVFDCPPRCNWQHTYRATVDLGTTSLSADQVLTLVQKMSGSPMWQGNNYDLLHNNCLHFANAFCAKLGVRNIPGWLNRFDRIGVHIQRIAENTVAGVERTQQLARGISTDFDRARRQTAPRIVEAAQSGVQGLGISLARWGQGLIAAATRAVGDDKASKQNRRQARTDSGDNDLRAALRNRGGVRRIEQPAPPPTGTPDQASAKGKNVNADAFLLLEGTAPPEHASTERTVSKGSEADADAFLLLGAPEGNCAAKNSQQPEEAAQKEKEEADRLQKEADEAAARAQREQEEADRQKAREEAAQKEKEEADRLQKEADEAAARAQREQEEADRQKAREEAAQKEKEEADRLQKEADEAAARAQREQEEADRQKEREEAAQKEKEEADRLQKEADEAAARAQREQEEADRQKEREEAAQKEKEEADRLQKEADEAAARAQREQEEAAQKEKEEADRLQKEADEAAVRAQRQQEEADRQKEREEAAQKEKEEADRLQKEADEAAARAQREQEEADRQKEREEAAQKEKEEADRLQKEADEAAARAQREQEEADRQKEREEAAQKEKEEADRLQKEADEAAARAQREQEEADRQKEREEAAQKEKEEADRLQKEADEAAARAQREQEEADRQKEREEDTSDVVTHTEESEVTSKAPDVDTQAKTVPTSEAVPESVVDADGVSKQTEAVEPPADKSG